MSASEETQSYPLVTVTIVACNRREELRMTLQKVTQELEYPRDRLEIIVVDNASKDGTADMLAAEFPAVKVISNATNEGAPAWNRAFAVGGGDYFVILDDDCYIAGDSLKQAVQTAREEQADLVSFRVSAPGADGYYFNSVYNPGLLGFWGCSALVSRPAIKQLGGYDPNIFVWGNEVELTMRLLDAGLKHLFLPAVVACHYKKPYAATPSNGSGPKFHSFFETTNRNNLAYIAGKALRPAHAVAAFANLVIHSCSMFYFYRSPGAVASFVRANITGFARGLRHRQPVSRRISSVYKKNLVDFANPLVLLMKRPGRQRFCAARPQYYPTSQGSLVINREQ